MFHLELRQFPHTVTRFNLDDRELWVIVEPWVREQVFELGERKWSPHQAQITILEGPQLSVEELSLGRGWRSAQRGGKDITEAALGRAKQAIDVRASAEAETSAPPPAPPAAALAPTSPAPSSAVAEEPASDPLALGVQLASLLGHDPARLLSAWRQIVVRAPALSPSESLALAERELAAPSPGAEPAR
jgi:hypothetical protein